MTTTLAKTPLHDWHVAHGGRMVDFAGWSMPVQYTSIAEEHQATRTAVGVFDISHMGRLQLSGPGAMEFLDSVLTRRVTDMKPGQIRYALVCNGQAGILDDVLVYRLLDAPSSVQNVATYQVVVNASNRMKIIEWFMHRMPDSATQLTDVTTDTSMIAVQGPSAIELIDPLVNGRLSTLRYFTSTGAEFDGHPISLSRTGYTGEEGCEIICPANDAVAIWERILAAGKGRGAVPVGLGARDTLRLEAALPLYGHELSESINPVQAGLGFAVDLGDRVFTGSDILEKLAAAKNQPVRVGLQLDGKRVPRQGCAVMQGDEPVGEVTSGTFSPTLQRPIAMAYVRPSVQAAGTRLAVDIRGTQHPAIVVALPFYKRGK